MTWRASITIQGLYEFNNNIFDYFYIPDGINKDDLITLILSETLSFEILYPSPEVMRNLIGVWSRKMLPIWQDLYNSTQLDYDFMRNYDLYEDVKEGVDRSSTSNVNDTGASTETYHNTDTTTYGGTQENVQSVSGFNTETWANANKANATSGGSDTTNTNSTDGKTSNNTTNASGKEEQDRDLNRHKYGLLGGVRPATMIKDYRSISDYSVYDVILSDFIQKFCLMVY